MEYLNQDQAGPPSNKSAVILRVLGIWAMLLGTSGCLEPKICYSNLVFGLNVTVVGGAESLNSNEGAGGVGGGDTTAMSECAAMVTARDGDYSETLECTLIELDCLCYGAAERKGKYAVS